jgi:hypothetical protein
VLALSLHQHRADAEVLISPPEALNVEIGRFKPHLVVCSEGAVPDIPSGVVCRVEIIFSDRLDARSGLDVRVVEAKDVGTEDLLALVDQTEKMISREEAVD